VCPSKTRFKFRDVFRCAKGDGSSRVLWRPASIVPVIRPRVLSLIFILAEPPGRTTISNGGEKKGRTPMQVLGTQQRVGLTPSFQARFSAVYHGREEQ
jgi:hypothetical protein